MRPHCLFCMLQVLQLQSLQSYQNKAVPSAALLFVHTEAADSLPVSHLQFVHITHDDSTHNMSVSFFFTVEEEWKRTQSWSWACSGWNNLQNQCKTLKCYTVLNTCIRFTVTVVFLQLCDRSTTPHWNESFYFLVHDPKHQMLVVKARTSFTTYLHVLYSVRVCVWLWVKLLSPLLHCSCPVDGTSRWDLWWFLWRICLLSHSWSWISGYIWMEPHLKVRSCLGLNSRS